MASQFTVIVPAWTLSVELQFYILAPFILRRNVLLIAALAYASHRLRWDGYHYGFYSEATNYRFFPFELSLFLYGAICFRLGKFLIPTGTRWSGAITAGACLMVVAPLLLFQGYQYELYAVIGLLLPALFNFSDGHEWDRKIGDLSYPLYLVHWPIGAFGAAMASQHSVTAAIITIIVAIAAAIGIDRYIDAPVDRWRQRRAASSKYQRETIYSVRGDADADPPTDWPHRAAS